MVSPSSVEGLQPYLSSGNSDERELAAALISAIQNGALTLGNPAAQNATRAQYGQRLQVAHGNAVIVANFRVLADGRFDLVMAVMRDSMDPSRKVTIAVHHEASNSAPAQPRPASSLSLNQPPPSPPPVRNSGNQVAGPSSHSTRFNDGNAVMDIAQWRAQIEMLHDRRNSLANFDGSIDIQLSFAEQEMTKLMGAQNSVARPGVPSLSLPPRASIVSPSHTDFSQLNSPRMNRPSALLAQPMTLAFIPEAGAHATNPLGLSPVERGKIASMNGGDLALNFICGHHNTLTGICNLTKADIVKIASNSSGGMQALQAVINLHSELTKIGLSNNNIVNIAANNGGSQALRAVFTHHPALIQAGFSNDQIAKIAGNYGGAQTVQAVIDLYHLLTNAGLNNKNIVKIAGNSGGAQALRAVVTHHPALIEAGFSNDHVVKIGGNRGGAQALQAVANLHSSLEVAGFGNNGIVRIAGNIGGAQALRAVITHGSALVQRGFSNDDIVGIAGNNGGAQALQAVITHYPALIQAGYKNDGILALACRRRGAAGALRAAADANTDE
ncbi:TAL effector repeat-containing protein [Burkholderia metallica]|uniref:TAL effector repeat-containing protein n=1 Tax=Burkholderia metallica TaxID=488729 RepID=UPI001CF5D54F|nr:TAL effector repeat-containing protein [Burkholderia metallica]MCA8003297.1 TAL effector repeat-containing protein [Burkholderia metallica]